MLMDEEQIKWQYRERRRMLIETDIVSSIVKKRLQWNGYVRRSDKNQWINKMESSE